MSKTAIAISVEGMIQTTKGAHEVGKGWFLISLRKVEKSKNLLRLAYRNNMINKAEAHSISTCFFNIVKKGLLRRKADV